MKILVHICCGPCAAYPIPWLIEQGHEATGYYYNPNIHPYQEWERRLQGVKELAAKENIRLLVDDRYDVLAYFEAIAFREEKRCFMCYELRLNQAAHIARTGKFDGFTTTLLVSPYQKHELVREMGEAAGGRYGVPFLYFDFRPGFKAGQEKAREMGLYRQQYCGCLYSEVERYAPKEHWPLLERRKHSS